MSPCRQTPQYCATVLPRFFDKVTVKGDATNTLFGMSLLPENGTNKKHVRRRNYFNLARSRGNGGYGMAHAPLKFCERAGCRCFAIPHSAYCAEHSRLRDERRQSLQAVADKFRKTARERGYNYRWSRASKAFLTANPWCAECLRHGEHTPATEVDHIVPHKGDKKIFWDANNWQSLCHSCHSKKTAKERGSW